MSCSGVASLSQELPKKEFQSLDWVPDHQPLPVVAERVAYVGPVGEFEAGNVLYARDVMFQSLKQSYVLESPIQTEAFLQLRPNVITLLVEALAHLDRAFGRDCIKAIRLVQDDFESTSVFGMVFWADPTQRGREALARFDQDWWLNNCNRAGGIVNFNIELT